LLGAWIPGRNAIVFSAERDGPPHLFTRDLTTGEEREVRPSEGLQVASDVSPDGRQVLYEMREDKGVLQVWLAPLESGAPPSRFANAPFGQRDVRFSPNGDAVIFSSTESGRSEVFAASMPNMTGRVPVSGGGGVMARWSPDGGQIFYVSPDSNLMSVRVMSRNPIQLGAPTPLFALRGRWRGFEVAPGNRFLAIISRQVGNAQPLTALLNWTRRLAPDTPR
jgi:TolB protein